MYKKILSAVLGLSIALSGAVAVYAAPDGTGCIKTGNVDFEKFDIGYAWSNDYKSWAGQGAVAPSKDYPDSSAHGNKVLKLSAKNSNGIKCGIIGTGKYDDRRYSDLSADEDKLIQIKLDVLFPKTLLDEEPVQSIGINVMPGQGSYAFRGTIFDSLKYKAENGELVLTDGSKTYATVSTDQWHEIRVSYSFNDKTFRYYLDGVSYLTDVTAAAPILFNGDPASDYMACGMMIYAPGGISTDAYILADNLEIYQSDIKLTITPSYDSKSGEAAVQFSNAVDSGMLKFLSICDEDGNDIGAEFETVDERNAKIVFPKDSLKYATEYTFYVTASPEFTDKTTQYILKSDNKIEFSFKTPKDKSGIYLDDDWSKMTDNGTDIVYDAVIGNGTGAERDIIVGAALYAKNEMLTDLKIEPIRLDSGENGKSFVFSGTSGKGEFVRLYMWNGEDFAKGLICEPDTSDSGKPLTGGTSYTSETIPDFDIRVTDSVANKIAVSGKFDSPNSDFVTVAFAEGEAEKLSSDAKIAAIGYSPVNGKGEFLYEFTLNSSGGKYTALVTDGEMTYAKQFEYMPISVLADFVKDIASGAVAKDDICDKTKALNGGFGIDFDNYFNTDSEISEFNEYIDSVRSGLVSSTDEETVKNFIGSVNKLVSKIEFFKDASKQTDTQSLLKLLRSGTEYTGIDFGEFDKLNKGQQNRALAKMLGRNFESMSEIKKVFDRCVSDVRSIVYLTNGYADFDGIDAVSSNGGGFEMKFNGGNVQVVNDDVAKLKGEKNKALKTSPSQPGKGFYFGLIQTGQYNDKLYTAMGLDSEKLLCIGADVYFPSSILKEEYMSTTGLNLMPGSGNFVNDPPILSDSVFKKANENDTYLSFINGANSIKRVDADMWHNITVVYDFAEKTIRYYIDGEMCLKDYDVKTPIDLTDMGCGIRYVCPSTVSGDFTVYFDNIEIYQSENALSAAAEYEPDSDSLNIKLTGSIDENMLSEISVNIDGVKLSSKPALSEDGKTVSCGLSDLKLANDKEYTANVEFTSSLTDGIYQYMAKDARKLEQKFTTARSKEIYITDESAFDGSTYNVKVNNLTEEKEATVALGVYDSDEKLVNVCYKKQNMANGVNTVSFENVDPSKQIKAFLWTGEWNLMHNPIVTNAQPALETPIKADAVVPNYSVVTTDAGKEVMTVSGKYTGGEDSFVTVIISDASLDEYETKTVALESARTDKDGLFGCSFGMSKPSGTYKAYVIIGGTVYEKEFTYSSLSDTAAAVKKIANGEISQKDIYNGIIVYNSGLGIDTSYFGTQSRKDTFNKRVAQNKSALAGNSDSEYVSQFMNVVKNIIAELDYTKELQDIPYAGSILKKLESGREYTNIDFTAYNALTSYQKSLVDEDMLRAEFNDGDDIKSKFDSFVSEAKGKKETGGGSGTGSSSGSGNRGTGVVPTVTNNNQTNAENKDLFKDLTRAHWAAAAVARLVNKNVVSGMGNGMFEPDLNVTREQFVKMASLATSINHGKEKSVFTDVPDGSWYCEYVMAAKNSGIINGISENTFGTGMNITREDMAVIVYNILTKNNKTYEDADDSPSDFESVSEYAKKAVECLYSRKIINGMGDGTFAPKSYATRAQAAVIIDAMMTELEK